MSIDRTDIIHIARLARLAIEDKDIPAYVDSLSAILQLVQQLRKIDTDAIEPMSHPLELPQRQRNDVITETDSRASLLRNAPQVESGLFLVPKVIANDIE